MNCRAFDENLSEWLRGRLSPRRHRAMEAHRRVCSDCARAEAAERALAERLQPLGATVTVPDIWSRLSVRREALSVPLPVPVRSRRVWGLSIAATALFSLALLGALSGKGPRRIRANIPVNEAHVVRLIGEIRAADTNELN